MKKAAFGIGVALTLMVIPAVTRAETPRSLITPDKVESPIGALEFKDGAPSPDTVQKAFDAVDFNHALSAYLNSYGGASLTHLARGFAASEPRTTPSSSSRS
jgi:hypothetical protein